MKSQNQWLFEVPLVLSKGLNEFEDRFEWESSSAINVSKAVEANRTYMKSVGWQKYFDNIVNLLGFTTYTPDEQTFAQAVARWQQINKLEPDGIIGFQTWNKMKAALNLKLPPDRHTSQKEKTIWFQTILKTAGGQTNLLVSGKYDSQTKQALIRFQQQYGLEATGKITPETNHALTQVALEKIFFQQPISNQIGTKSEELIRKIKEFQQFYDLNNDGQVGAATRSLMVKILSKNLPTIFEPASEAEAVAEFKHHLQQLELSKLPGKPRHLVEHRHFNPLEVRQGLLLNCPLAAILVAMAHVDEDRSPADKRLPKLIQDKFIRPPVRSRRRFLLDIESRLRIKISQSFTSHRLFEVFFFGRRTPILVTPVLYWNSDPRVNGLHYAWSTTDALWPSLIEKAYISELEHPRNYTKLLKGKAQDFDIAFPFRSFGQV